MKQVIRSGTDGNRMLMVEKAGGMRLRGRRLPPTHDFAAKEARFVWNSSPARA
jgi:hypothetical protein